jgi:hypothetical protein
MTLGKPSLLATSEWCTVPFVRHPKTPFDRLVDILLQLPSIFSDHLVITSKDSTVSDRQGFIADHQNKINGLLTELENFGEENKSYLQPLYSKCFWKSGNPLTFNTEDLPLFDSTFQATVAAYYHAANLCCLRYLGAVLGGHDYEEQMNIHAILVISCAGFHKAVGAYSGGTFNMIFPLKIACMMSPCPRVKNYATEVLRLWEEQRGCQNMCSTAAPFFIRQYET